MMPLLSPAQKKAIYEQVLAEQEAAEQEAALRREEEEKSAEAAEKEKVRKKAEVKEAHQILKLFKVWFLCLSDIVYHSHPCLRKRQPKMSFWRSCLVGLIFPNRLWNWLLTEMGPMIL